MRKRRTSTWMHALRLWLRDTVPAPWPPFVLAYPSVFFALVLRAERAGFRHTSGDGFRRLTREVRELLAEGP